jgi:hypothetical protein
MSDNPRGIVIVKDELTGFVRGLNQYRGGKGADREFWLSGWAGAPAKKNRAGNHEAGPLHIPHPFVGVTGMLCPDMLPEIRGDLHRGESQADGFADRFLWSFPDPADAVGETWAEVPEDLERGYAEVMADLLGKLLVTEQDGAATRERPYFVTLDGDARAAWERFTTDMARQMNDLDKFDPFRGVLSKLRGYTLRFSALLWALRRICAELSPDAEMDAETIRRSVRLTDYFRAHGCRALGVGWADRPNRVARRLLGWLARNPDLKAFTRSQAFINLKDQRSVRTSEALEPVFRLLVDHQYLRPLDATGRSRPGPVPETYVVNPAWVRDAAEYTAGPDADAG